MLDVLAYPNDFLRQKALPVVAYNQAIRAVALGLAQVVKAKRHAGLSAPQVGVSLRILALRMQKDIAVLVNPEIVSRGELVSRRWEVCPSFPTVKSVVERPSVVTVKFWNVDGVPGETTVDDVTAAVLQHELDHLDGKLMIDLMSSVRRDIIDCKMKQLGRRAAQMAQRARNSGEVDLG